MIALLLTAAAAGLPQDADVRETIHLRNVFVERRVLAEQAWLAADESGRAAARELGAAYLAGSAGRAHALSAEILARYARYLAGEEPDDVKSLGQRLADALDLRVIPGAFEATDGERGEHVIVRVWPLYKVTSRSALVEELSLTLRWLGPDGESVRARTEPVHRDALVPPGFEMYISAPAARPGSWSLVPEVRFADRTWRGLPVAVECIPRLHTRADRLLDDSTRAEDERGALGAHLRQGLRDARYPGIARLLEGPAPHTTVALVDGTLAAVHRALPAKGETRAVVIVPVGRYEDPEWLFLGPSGEAWRRLAERGVCVVATSLDVVPASMRTSVLPLIEAFADEHEVILCVRGSDFGMLPIFMGADELAGLDRLVVSSVLLPGVEPRVPGELPCLFLQPLAEADRAPLDLEREGPDLRVVTRRAPPLFAELGLPGWIGDWLDAPKEGQR